jgi:hypothetical protein
MGLFGPSSKKMLWKVHDSLRARGHSDLDPRVVDLGRLSGYLQIGPMGIPRLGLSLDLAWRVQLIFFITGGTWGYCTLEIFEGPSMALGEELEFDFAPENRDITYEILALIEKLRADEED